MPTGAFWNLADPLRPVGLFDPDAELIFPVEITDWLAAMSADYLDHEVLVDLPLQCTDDGAYSQGVVPVTIRVAAGATATPGAEYPFTLRLRTNNGQQDDRTFWLRITER